MQIAHGPCTVVSHLNLTYLDCSVSFEHCPQYLPLFK